MLLDRAVRRATVGVLRRVAQVVVLLAGLALAPAPARTQQPVPTRPDPARAPADTLRPRADSAARADSSVRRPAGPRRPRATAAVRPELIAPITPRRAFLSSLLVPGLGQVKLDRPSAGALFVTVELTAIAMATKAAYDLRAAKRFRADSVVLAYPVDTLTGEPVRTSVPLAEGPFTNDLVGARRVHLEDWLAVIAFNHLIAGAEAFVSANLWDLPGQVGALRTARGPALQLSFRW
jgi:hypothetical protein